MPKTNKQNIPMEFHCPLCGGYKFGSSQPPGEGRTYRCHGYIEEQEEEGAYRSCPWKGTREEFLANRIPRKEENM